MEKIKVFFGCSMRGGYGTVSQESLQQIPDALEGIGLELMSRHQTQPGIIQEEKKLPTVYIHDRDHGWLEGCDLVVLELSNPSLGGGGETSDSVILGKPTLGLYQHPGIISPYVGRKLLEYPKGHHVQYMNLDHLKTIVREFIEFYKSLSSAQLGQRPETDWLEGAKIAVFDITEPHVDAGAKIADAVHMGIPVLGLYQQEPEAISAYIRGKLEKHPKGKHARYTDIADFETKVREFVGQHGNFSFHYL